MNISTRIVGLDRRHPHIQLLARWGGRAEDSSAVAARLLRTFKAIEEIDGTATTGWVKSLTPTRADPLALDSFVEKQAFRDEIGTSLPDHGYDFNVSRPATDVLPRVEIQVQAGSGHGDGAGFWINSVEVSFQGDFEIFTEYFSKNGAALLRGLVEEWAPDHGYAGVTGQRSATAQRYGRPGVLAVTWLSNQFSIPEAIPGAEVQDFAGGHLIYVGSAESADSSVEAAVGVHSFLVANGLGLAAANQPQV